MKGSISGGADDLNDVIVVFFQGEQLVTPDVHFLLTGETQRLLPDLKPGEHLDDAMVMRVTGRYSWSQTFRGKKALLRELYGHVGSLMAEPGKTIPDRIFADGDHVIVEARGEMLTKTGQRYDNEYCLIYRLAEGRIVEIREYQDSTLCEAILGPFPARGA